MSTSDDLIFSYGQPFLWFLVYVDRIKVAQQSPCTRNVALYRLADVAGVALVVEPGILQLLMRDGAAHAYQLGGNAEAARQAILRVLPVSTRGDADGEDGV